MCLSECVQLAAPLPQGVELVLQAAGQIFGLLLRLFLSCGDELQQLGLRLFQQPLQLRVNRPALLDLLLTAVLNTERTPGFTHSTCLIQQLIQLAGDCHAAAAALKSKSHYE